MCTTGLNEAITNLAGAKAAIIILPAYRVADGPEKALIL
jgi:hypothetical protein